MADNLQPTPRNQLLGLLSDAMYGGLDWMKDPRRSQQMQGLAGLLESTGIPKTTERMAYGEPLTNIGRANVPLLKPETAEAMMTVAPLAPAVGRGGKAVARMAGSEINAAMMGERGGLLGAVTPQPMRIIEKNPTPFVVKHGTNQPFDEFKSGMGVTAKHIYTTPEEYAKDAAKYGETLITAQASPKSLIDFSSEGKLDKPTINALKKAAKDAGITDQYYPFESFMDDLMSGQLYQKGGGSRTQDALLSELFTKYQAVKMPDAAVGGGVSKSVVFENPSLLKILPKNPSISYPQQAALDLAQARAAQLGQSLESYPRSLQQGYEHDWYHGTTGDITNFRQDLLGETTGAQSAKKGFFFARDPQNPPASMMVKSTDPTAGDLLRKLGIPEEEIAKLNQVSMQGHGAETASGYAKIGGTREYKEAMRKANAAEKRGDWNEYEKQMQIAEDSEIKRMNYAQSVIAKYGDARDEMLDAIQKSIYNKKLPQAEADALDAKVKQLMPYGWYNIYSQPQLQALKKEIVNLVGEDAANPALKQIDKFKSIKAERHLVEQSQEGGNVMPVALRYKNPMVHDFGGSAYRDQTYSDLVDQALRGGHDALILKNTFDPAGSPSKLIDVGVVFNPDQIRSRFAAFDPFRKDVATATAMGVALPDLLAAEPTPEELQRRQSSSLLFP